MMLHGRIWKSDPRMLASQSMGFEKTGEKIIVCCSTLHVCSFMSMGM